MRYVALRARHVRGECPEDGKGRTGINKVDPVCSSLYSASVQSRSTGPPSTAATCYKCPVSHGEDAAMILQEQLTLRHKSTV